MNKRILLRLILLLVFVVVLTSSISYAWFTLTDQTNPIMLYSGSLRSKGTLYYVKNEDTKIEITSENYQFTGLLPGAYYHFEVVMKNEGTIAGNLMLEMEINSNNQIEFLNHFEIQYENPFDDSFISTKINENNYRFFETYYLEQLEELVFRFTIYIDPLLGNIYQENQFTINHLKVRLDQIILND